MSTPLYFGAEKDLAFAAAFCVRLSSIMSRAIIQKPDDDPTLLTISEFIKIAAGRGKSLWLEDNKAGGQRITDGARRHSLPRMPGGLMPSGLVEVLVELFFDGDELAVDFALDPRDD